MIPTTATNSNIKGGQMTTLFHNFSKDQPGSFIKNLLIFQEIYDIIILDAKIQTQFENTKGAISLKKIITITGASGSGKDSLLDAVLYRTGNLSADKLKGISAMTADEQCEAIPMRELISHTTREPRKGEINGVDYYFVNDAEFSKLDKLESIEYAGNKYCLASEELEKLNGAIGCVIVDTNGLTQIKNYIAANPDVQLFKIFITIDADTSRRRMTQRGDDEDKIQKRMRQQSYRKEYIVPSDDFELVLDGTASFTDNVDAACSALLEFAHRT